MPNYDYQCDKCGKTFEVFQSMTAKRLTKCPDKKCGGKVKRLLGTGAGLIFKGSGFYITDYRSESYKQGASSETKAASAATDSGSSSGGDTKAATPAKESKPAAKPEAKSKPKGKGKE
jgi:putative FmdB family regulatory protein